MQRGIAALAAEPAGSGAAAAPDGNEPEELAWYRVSDQHVKRVDWAAVQACEAYILLYARV